MLAEYLRENLEKPVDLTLRNNQGRHQAQDPVPCVVDEQTTVQTILHHQFRVKVELNALQEAKAANIPHDTMSLLAFRQTLGQIVSHAASLIEHSAFH
jgi:hypothetical protein